MKQSASRILLIAVFLIAAMSCSVRERKAINNKKSESYFKRAVTLYSNFILKEAYADFMITLAYNPDKADANVLLEKVSTLILVNAYNIKGRKSLPILQAYCDFPINSRNRDKYLHKELKRSRNFLNEGNWFGMLRALQSYAKICKVSTRDSPSGLDVNTVDLIEGMFLRCVEEAWRLHADGKPIESLILMRITMDVAMEYQSFESLADFLLKLRKFLEPGINVILAEVMEIRDHDEKVDEIPE